MTKEKPVIALDVDGCICNMAQVLMSVYNYKSICDGSPPFIENDVYRVEDINQYDIVNLIGRDCFSEIIKIMQAKKACMRFPIYENAKEVYSKLTEIGDVVFVTKPFNRYKDWYIERNFWIRKYFGVDSENIIYVSKKYLVNADILIDDCPAILEDWIKYTGKPAIKVERPWNKDFDLYGLSRVQDIREIPELIKELL